MRERERERGREREEKERERKGRIPLRAGGRHVDQGEDGERHKKRKSYG